MRPEEEVFSLDVQESTALSESGMTLCVALVWLVQSAIIDIFCMKINVLF